MDPQTILKLYDQEMREDVPPGRATVIKRPGLTYFVLPQPSQTTGWVIYTRLDPASADQAIQSTLDFFRQYGGEFEWKVYGHDMPSDLKARLLAHGFVPEEKESVLALDLETAPSEFWTPLSAGIRRLTDPRQLADVTRIGIRVWGESFAGLEATLADEMRETPDQLSVYVAYVGDEPVSSAWIRFYPGRQFAELYGGATVPAQRGKGWYTALVKVRAQEARPRGVRFLVVDASAMSRPVLEKRGFVYLVDTQPFIMNFDKP